MARPIQDTLYFSSRLREMLRGALAARSVLVEAPAGYGKTTAIQDGLRAMLPEVKGSIPFWRARKIKRLWKIFPWPFFLPHTLPHMREESCALVLPYRMGCSLRGQN